jgi:alpha-L-rhamnosidase
LSSRPSLFPCSRAADHTFLRSNAIGANYGDWLAPDPNTPKTLIDTAYWALVTQEMTEMATALHRPADAEKYRQQYNDIAAAYRVAFIKDDGSVAGNSQTAYLATLFTGIAPPSLRANMVDRLAKDIEAHGNHLTTGFLGTPLLMFVLDENQRSDLAFKLLLSDTYPSWGYMVKKGATTWWERWNGDTGDPSMNSYNHYAFGSVMAWVYRRVPASIPIRPAPDSITSPFTLTSTQHFRRCVSSTTRPTVPSSPIGKKASTASR